MDIGTEIIRLRPEDTKTEAGRIIPLTKELSEPLKNVRIYLDAGGHRVSSVFTYTARHIGSVPRTFKATYREGRITDTVFHDLRHTFVTNMRRAGVDYFRIMAILGYKPMSVFKR